MSSTGSSTGGATSKAKRPRKNERARRERLRKKYLDMIDEMTSQQLDFTDRNLVDSVKSCIKESTGMAMYVTDPREASYDMKYLKHISEICTGLATSLSIDTKFDTCEFLHKAALKASRSGQSNPEQNVTDEIAGSSGLDYFLDVSHLSLVFFFRINQMELKSTLIFIDNLR